MIVLTDREKEVLKYVVQQFILTALPVGSRFISKKYELGLSSASIRNIMSDLEEMGLINQPHTSAGRIPTDLGYRYYVDLLMGQPFLSDLDIEKIDTEFNSAQNETDEILSITSKILSNISKNISCVLYPNLNTAMLEKINLVKLSSSALLVVITINTKIIRTINLELKIEIFDKYIEKVQNLLNEKLAGLTLLEIRSTFADRFKDVDNQELPLIRIFLEFADRIFADVKKNDKVHISGTSNILEQPEFGDLKKFKSIVELIENKDVIIHIFEEAYKEYPKDSLVISIGNENTTEKLKDYSLVLKDYKIKDVSGTLGVIGPKRMDYDKVIAIVDYLSEMLSNYLKKESL